MRCDTNRRRPLWWLASLAFLIAMGLLVAYFAELPMQILDRADKLGSVGSLVTGVVALLVSGLSLRVGMRSGVPPSTISEPVIEKPARPNRETVDGTLSPVWNVAPRNPSFVGREQLLQTLHRRLCTGGTAVVQAVHGMGGAGKTQVATEYAYRFAREYDLVWWIASENAELIGEQLASLGLELRLPGAETDPAASHKRTSAYLRSHPRWLLIFDNAEDPAHVREWLPGGPGHVLITSRNPSWEEVAIGLDLDVFTRSESIALLVGRLGCSDASADDLAEALGDLPLALAQAASTIAETGIPVGGYLAALSTEAAQVLEDGSSPAYPATLVSAVRLSAGNWSGL
jgi:hypothetical protein